MNLRHLVFIEDDLLDFEIFKSSLTQASHSFLIHHETDVNKDFYQKYDYRESIIFLDLRLGNKNGREIFLNQLKDRKYITFMLSSSDDPNDIQKCKNIGLAGYFQKKDSIEKIISQLSTIIDFSNINLLY